MISVGAVAESGQQFHLVSKEARLDQVDEWVKQNVVAHLPDRTIYPEQWVSRRDLRDALADFVSETVRVSGKKPELVFWYGAYDWVAICQLFGGMVKLPADWPRFYTDLKWQAEALGDVLIPAVPVKAHDALADALWNYSADRYLQGYAAGRQSFKKGGKRHDK